MRISNSISLILSLFISAQVQAQSAKPKIEEAANEAVAQAGNAVDSYATAVGNFFKKHYEGYFSDPANRLLGAYGGATGDSKVVEAATKAREEAKQIRISAGAKAANALTQAGAALEKTLSAAGATVVAAKDTVVGKTETAAILAQVYSGAFLTMKLSRLYNKNNDINESMRVVEGALDKTILAGYLQEKMAKLLNSDNLCKAANSCAANKGTNKAGLKSADLKDIFPFAEKPSPAAQNPTSTAR